MVLRENQTNTNKGKGKMKTFKQHVKEGSYSGYMGAAQGVGVAVQISIEDGSLGSPQSKRSDTSC